MADTKQAAHPIQVAARRTGLSTYVLRAWEQRYRAVAPQRSATGRRLYSDDEIERLQLLQFATRAGRRIGDVASLSREDLLAICAADTNAIAPPTTSTPFTGDGWQASEHYCACLKAIRQLDPAALESALYNACLAISLPVLLEDVLSPLLRTVGHECRQGAMRIGEEHMATAAIRSFLGTLKVHHSVQPADPRIVVAAPAGQMHELGALMAAVSAAAEGWNAIYLGADTPADEIAAAAVRTQASAVAISIVYSASGGRTAYELKRLRRQLKPHIALLVGGGGAHVYAPLLSEIDASLFDRLTTLRDALTRLTTAAASTAVSPRAGSAPTEN